MAITDPSLSSTATPSLTTTRVLRGLAAGEFDDHRFESVADLPRVAASRPRQTGNSALDAIRAAAWDEAYASGRVRGADDGYAEGFERGLVEGRDIGRHEGAATAQEDAVASLTNRLASALGALDDAAAALDRRDAVTLAAIEGQIVDLALSLAEAILAREITIADDPGRDALRRALELAPDHDRLVAHLNPSDLDLMGDVADLAPGRRIELVADSSIGRGGCVVEAGAARLDARIESALERVREVLAP